MRKAFGTVLIASFLGLGGLALFVRSEIAMAQSVPPTVTDTFATRLNESANSGNFATGDILFLGAHTVTPSASPPSYGFAYQCPIGSTCTPGTHTFTDLALFSPGWALAPDQWQASTTYNQLLTGPWGLVVS